MDPDNHRIFLGFLLWSLLRADATLPLTERETEEWEEALYAKVKAQWPESFPENPLPASDSWFGVTSATRVSRVHCGHSTRHSAVPNYKSNCGANLRRRWTSCTRCANGGPMSVR